VPTDRPHTHTIDRGRGGEYIRESRSHPKGDTMADVDPKGVIFVGKSGKPELLSLPLANRHGLVTGATGTGKTVTLQVLAEGFARAGVSVFAADIKGDLSGIAAVGEAKEALVARAKSLGFDYEPDEFPVVFWDLFGEQGHPIRATVSEVGPLLLSRLMDAQRGAGGRAQHHVPRRRRTGAP
jgi:hypothetical protein